MIKVSPGMLGRDLLDWVDRADVAYQPIVSAQLLRVHGFEALSRLPDHAPFAGITSLFDAAAGKQVLREVERSLLTKAISKFARYDAAFKSRLFCNVDNRVFDDADASPTKLVEYVRTVTGIGPSREGLSRSGG